MGNISEKLTYLNTTKTQLKGMINYGLDENNKITNETTFRDYVKSIFKAFLESLNNPDTLFTNLPKKSQEGVNITLNDTANAPMRIGLGASEMSQSGTPTPDSSQDIHTISGSNTIKANGKNLAGWKTETINGITLTNNNDGSYTLNGTSTANANFISTNKLGSANRTLTIQVDKTPSGSFFVGARNESLVQTRNITISTSVSLNTPISTSGNQIDYLTYIYIPSGITLNNVKIYIQLENGGSFTSFKPYTSQEADINLVDIEYCKKGNYEDEFIRTSGKNLFDKDNTNILNNTYIGSSALGTSNGAKTLYIPCQPNTTYTISRIAGQRFIVGDTSTTPASGVSVSNRTADNTGTNLTITTSANAQYLVVFYYLSGTDTLTEQAILDTIMIEKNDTATSYEPYGTNEWYIKKSIGKVVFNGSEYWEQTGSTIKLFRTRLNGILNYNYNIMCNNFTPQTSYTTTILDKYCYHHAGNYYNFEIRYDDITTIADFKNWLSTHNTEVYYILATPTYTPLIGTLAEQLENIYQKLKSFEGTTNISQVNNDLPFVLNVQALENLE